jgi:opacity protein-like surface antigen
MDLMSFAIRLCSVLLMAASTILGQGISFGVKGGVPLTDALHVLDRSRYLSNKAPFVIGPAVELRLFAGLSAEANLLYRRVEYTSTTQATPQVVSRTTGQTFEVPVLAKYRVPGELFRPFVSAGLSYRRLARFEQRLSTGGISGTVQVSKPPELTNRSTSGATVAGGLEVSLPLIRVSAELRYTRWGSSSFRSALSGLASQLNQADFLLGILF